LLNIFARSWKDRILLAGGFLIIFTLTVSPWLYLNGRRHGSPLYNTNYLNMATQFYPELVAGKTNQDGTRVLAEKFAFVWGCASGTIRGRFGGGICERYGRALRNSLTERLVSVWVGILALIGMLAALWRSRTRGAGGTAGFGAALPAPDGAQPAGRHATTFFLGVLYAGLAFYADRGNWWVYVSVPG
jgi:hypothetical protein